MTKGQPPTQQDLTGLGSHGCSQCVGSLRFDGADGQPGQARAGNKSCHGRSDKLQARRQHVDAMTMTVRPLMFLDLFREGSVPANKMRVDQA